MLTKKAQYAFRALTVLAKRQSEEEGADGVDQRQGHRGSVADEPEVFGADPGGFEIRWTDQEPAGPTGGHALSEPAESIMLAKVIRLMDGPIAPLSCVSLHFYERCEDCVEEDCGLHRTMVEVRDAQLSVLESRSVADLINS